MFFEIVFQKNAVFWPLGPKKETISNFDPQRPKKSIFQKLFSKKVFVGFQAPSETKTIITKGFISVMTLMAPMAGQLQVLGKCFEGVETDVRSEKQLFQRNKHKTVQKRVHYEHPEYRETMNPMTEIKPVSNKIYSQYVSRN